MSKYHTRRKFSYSHDIDDIDGLSDGLGRLHIVQAIAREVRSDAPPRIIGVYGWWGSGKSYLLSQTIKQLLDENKSQKQQIVACTFPAWRYEVEGDLAPGLINTLMNVEQQQFREQNPTFKNTETYKNVGKFLMNLVSTVGPKLGPAGAGAAVVVQIGKQVVDSVDERKQSMQPPPVSVDMIQNKMTALVDAILSAAYEDDDTKQHRLVVFVDDLDRCSPKNMVRMFEWLKVHLISDNCTYVIGLDNTAAARAIVGHYKNYIGDEEGIAYGFRYLEKLIDIEYELRLPLHVEQMALRQVYEKGVRSDTVREAISGQELGYNFGDFPGVGQIDKLLNMRSLKTPRTMLKIVSRYQRVLEILINTPDLSDLKTKLGLGYPFWTLFLIAMYYRLDPTDLADFIRARGDIYKLMSNHEQLPEERWELPPLSPKREFFVFSRNFSQSQSMQVPESKDLKVLATIIFENSYPQ